MLAVSVICFLKGKPVFGTLGLGQEFVSFFIGKRACSSAVRAGDS